MTQLRVHAPRPQRQPTEHVADEALRTELTAAALVLQTNRVPGLLRLVTDLARAAFDCGRRHDTAIVARALERCIDSASGELSVATIPVETETLPMRVVTGPNRDWACSFRCRLVAVSESVADYEVAIQ